MLEDLKMRAVEPHGHNMLDPHHPHPHSGGGEQMISSMASLRAKQMQVIDLERNILQVNSPTDPPSSVSVCLTDLVE